MLPRIHNNRRHRIQNLASTKPLGFAFFGLLVLGSLVFYGGSSLLAETFLSPLQLKQDALTALDQISTTDKKLQRTIKKAIDKITRSLSDFLDESRVSDKKVFERERDAVGRLLKAIKRNHTPPDIKTIFQEVINDLVEADRGIAELSIVTAQQLVQVGEGNAKKLVKAPIHSLRVWRQTCSRRRSRFGRKGSFITRKGKTSFF